MTSEATVARISAVILNWKDAEQTLACVESVLQDAGVASAIVVDNESDGELSAKLSLLDQQRISLIAVPDNRGFSGGVNVGLREFVKEGGDYALVINNDALLEVGALDRMIDSMESDRSLSMVGPKILNPDGSVQSMGGRMNNLTLNIDDTAFPGRIDFLTWACVLVRRETLQTVGLLDERFFMYWEDVDFGRRVRDANGRLAVVPDALVRHNISSSHSEAGIRVLAYSAYGLSALGSKYRAWLAGALWRGVARVIKQVVRRRRRAATSIALGWIRGLRAESPAYDFAPNPSWPARSSRQIRGGKK
ncbi:MAG: glycosyltransferase family 2 protein [Solirubrobacterales bacterium]